MNLPRLLILKGLKGWHYFLLPECCLPPYLSTVSNQLFLLPECSLTFVAREEAMMIMIFLLMFHTVCQSPTITMNWYSSSSRTFAQKSPLWKVLHNCFFPTFRQILEQVCFLGSHHFIASPNVHELLASMFATKIMFFNLMKHRILEGPWFGMEREHYALRKASRK